jgi:hypothetical protein
VSCTVLTGMQLMHNLLSRLESILKNLGGRYGEYKANMALDWESPVITLPLSKSMTAIPSVQRYASNEQQS